MSAVSENAKAIFLEAVEKHSSEEWPDFLDQACAGDRELRGHVEGLLHAHSEKDSLFDRVEATADYQPLVRPGQTIGPYKIREQIGDGGMGVVYVAEQEKPLRRKVALKVIKPGMDSKAVLARFDAERNALALMNHPNIAKVLDAGTTEQGHPYFVMELIQGKPITEYCDDKKLTINQRLELFTQICNAVQHAHQKGVIHRDIKPSNILVTEIDGKPVPKVIDFGVAKALGANLTDRTIYTSFQALVGTPLYMSPEQTHLSGVDVDTSSDVYSLGILLYELLTGTTPLSPEELKQAAQDEVLRRIRETEPPRPSNRISSLGETSTLVSQCRGTQPEHLGRLVRGDLDWIVMKALEKDRNRRYKTADALAADIGRHVASEPVEARPPSTAYRLSRLYKRNKVVVAVLATIFSVAVIAAVAMMTAYRKNEQLLERLVNEKREWVYLVALSGDERLTRQAIQSFQDSVPKSLVPVGWKEFVLGLCAFENGDWSGAREHFRASHQAEPSIAAEAMLAQVDGMDGKLDEFAHEVRRLVKLPPETSDDYLFLARAVRWTSNFGNAKSYLDQHSDSFKDRPSYSILEQMIRLAVDANLAQRDLDSNEASRLAFEFDTIRQLSPHSVSLREETLANHNWAYRLLMRDNRPTVAQRHHDAIMRIDREVMALDGDHRSVAQLATFYEDLGWKEKAREYWQAAESRGMSGKTADFEYKYFLLRQGDYEQAMKVPPDNHVAMVLPHVMAMLGAGDPLPKEFLKRYQDDPKIPVLRAILVASWYLCGDHERARSLARTFSDEEIEEFENHAALNRVLRYYAGDESDPHEFLERSANSTATSLEDVFVALRLIGEGGAKNRADAEHLARRASKNSGAYFPLTLSRTVLRLLEDGNWPKLSEN